MWEAALDGRKLHFHLVGINDQNFLMQDEETGSWWQQVSGEAVAGPLAGRRLRQVPNDELTFGTWRVEQPTGRVLEPAAAYATRYARPDWEAHVARLPTVTPRDPADLLAERDIVVGVELEGSSEAFLLSDVLAKGGAVEGDVLILVNTDGRSIRAFSRRVGGNLRPIVPRAGSMVDPRSSDVWDFAGHAVSGPSLSRVPFLIDYWFDWKKYHPKTRVRTPDGPDAARVSSPSSGGSP